jgi:hypothetical protein
MKSKLIIMAALCAIAFTANAQTKGTNAVSFGFGSSKSEQKYHSGSSSSESTQKNNSVSLGYGFFFKDNEKIGLNLTYGFYKYETTPNIQDQKTYGGSLSYQKYYPIVKKLYAYAGGQAGYEYGRQSQSVGNNFNFKTNEYTAGAFGGISWFASKRFAFEANVLSANFGYFESKQSNSYGQGTQETKNTNFGISSQGVFSDLGFKIYVLF